MEPLRSGDPRRISSYEILNRLGAGGMGQVYLGRSPSGRRVAVKVIRPELTNDPTFRQRFRREVTAMRQVSGFFTAPVVDADPDGDPAWLATAFVPGPSLESAVADAGAMPHQDVILLAAGLAEALNAIHREGLTHRDLKPGNVLMAEDGPRVIDFGLAVTAETSGLTQAGTVVGTPAFMSPEQVSGQHVGPASDIWSLGAVLAYAATGASPFGDGGTMETMLRVMNGEPDLSGLTGTLAQLVSACMMKDPNARPTPARILQVLSEDSGVQPTMAMEVQPPVAEAGGAAGGAGAGVGAGAGAEPVWPTGENAAQVQGQAQASQAAAPVRDSGQNAGPASGSNPAAPAWNSGQNAGPASGSNSATPGWNSGQNAGPASGPAPTWGSGPVGGPAPSQPPAPAWGSGTGAPSQPSQPSHPAWGSGPAAPSQPSQPSQPTNPAWGSQPSQPSQPAWGSGSGSGPVAGPTSGPNPAAPTWGPAPSQPPAPAWGSTPSASSSPAWGTPIPPGPVSGPSTPPQPMPAHPTPNQWPQTSGQQAPPTSPMYQPAPPTQAAQAASPWMQPQPSPPYGVPMPSPAPAKRNRNGLIAAVGVAAVVVIGGGIAIFASSGGSGGSSGGSGGGTSGGTLGGSGGIGTLTPIPANFQLSGLLTDADAAQYLKSTPAAAAPTDDSTDDPATYGKDWTVSSTNAELRIQASTYKGDSKQATSDFLNHTSTIATDTPFEDEGALGNSDKTEIQVSTDQSSGLQHCQIEVLRGGLDVNIVFVEPGSAAGAHADVLNIAKQVTGRLPGK
ncbi:serine/threonine protein kinase [Catenulispora sp. GP43]|uniref:serine/threonine-protein kinase n=1 Tax=Catenulispora sp. GP43 TaxID=3156263 RepID=UPI003516BA16